jgi:hypothetical protein
MEKIIWTNRVRNLEVLQRVKEERITQHVIKEGRLIGLRTSGRGTAL